MCLGFRTNEGKTITRPGKQANFRTNDRILELSPGMNPGYVFFLLGALCICAIVLINYVQLQSEITTTANTISPILLAILTSCVMQLVTTHTDLSPIKV